MRFLVWLLRAALFFALFAFAINNQHEVSVHWFFGQDWRAPMVFVVLAAFTIGCVVGGLAMAPSWWRHRRRAHSVLSQTQSDTALAAKPTSPPMNTPLAPDTDLDSSHPVIHGV
jgi:lipopolysaccharide assembly protein A